MDIRTMTQTIAVIDGHPDRDQRHYCHALADAYAAGAQSAGHVVHRINIRELDLPFLRSREEWDSGQLSPIVRECQSKIGASSHVVIIYPLWLGSMPAMLKAFFEQVFRPGFAIQQTQRAGLAGLLKGKSARVVVTMGMPSWLYRWFFFAHSLRSLERNILRFSGFKKVRENLIGSVEASAQKRERWLKKMSELGQRAA